MHFTDSQAREINILTIIISLFFIIFFIFYIIKVNQLKIEILLSENNQSGNLNEDESSDKQRKIYEEIISYLEEKKPYCNSDFNIAQLASALNTNVTYISKGINNIGNTSFNTLINTYRINYIESLLKKGYFRKFTISYIYKSAGFKHQTTFNKVFKQIRGITPSEYIKSIDNGFIDDVID